MPLALRPRVAKRAPSPDAGSEDDDDDQPPTRRSRSSRPRRRRQCTSAREATFEGEDEEGEAAVEPRQLVQGTTWNAEEDHALIEAIETHGTSWKKIESDLARLGFRRSVAMCRNRYQRMRAPQQEGNEGRNRCKKCGEIKRGHTCTPEAVAAHQAARVAAAGGRAPRQGGAGQADMGLPDHSIVPPTAGNDFTVVVDEIASYLRGVSPEESDSEERDSDGSLVATHFVDAAACELFSLMYNELGYIELSASEWRRKELDEFVKELDEFVQATRAATATKTAAYEVLHKVDKLDEIVQATRAANATQIAGYEMLHKVEVKVEELDEFVQAARAAKTTQIAAYEMLHKVRVESMRKIAEYEWLHKVRVESMRKRLDKLLEKTSRPLQKDLHAAAEALHKAFKEEEEKSEVHAAAEALKIDKEAEEERKKMLAERLLSTPPPGVTEHPFDEPLRAETPTASIGPPVICSTPSMHTSHGAPPLVPIPSWSRAPSFSFADNNQAPNLRVPPVPPSRSAGSA